MPTIQEHVAAAREALCGAGIGRREAELSARMLAEHVLGWDAARTAESRARGGLGGTAS